MENRNFYYYFKYSMDSLHMPAPEGLYSSFAAALASTKALFEVVKRGGLGTFTLREIFATIPGNALRGAGGTELLAVAGGVLASAYVGAVIGALIYATLMTCAPSKMIEISDALCTSVFDLMVWSRRQLMTF